MIILCTAAVLTEAQTSKQDDVPDRLKVHFAFTLLCTGIVLEQIVLALSQYISLSFSISLSLSLLLSSWHWKALNTAFDTVFIFNISNNRNLNTMHVWAQKQLYEE